MAELELTGVSKYYGEVPVIKSLDLTVERGQFITLLGPSGCGKSTTLQMIAGLEAPTKGSVSFQGRTLASAESNVFIEPERRDFGVVFQSYALWPHMTVTQNLAFPLKVRRIAAVEQAKRISETLELVGLANLGNRYPGQLSGGQQQRVGLARALVYNPSLLLLDEPLSNLDALLREQARVWLKEIQLRLNMTTIYVTHDQTEALSLSDRIIVMKDGVVQQNGTPEDIYDRPATKFVAEFVGSANFLMGQVTGTDAVSTQVTLRNGQTATIASDKRFETGSSVIVAVRPERLTQEPIGDGHTNMVKLDLRRSVYVGERFSYEMNFDGMNVQAYGPAPIDAGQVNFYFSQNAATLFPDETAAA